MDWLLTAGSTSYTWDRNANQLSAGTRTVTWDLGNRMKTTTASGTTTTYSYDGDSVRLQASTGTAASAKTNFEWDTNNGLPMLAGLLRVWLTSLLRESSPWEGWHRAEEVPSRVQA